MRKVYIIDDDPDFLDIARHILSKDYDVKAASQLDLNQLADFQPELILMDNVIGAKNSEGIVKEIKAAIPAFSTPIILVSGHHDLPYLAQNPGIVGYIQKPASISHIRNYIANYFAA